MTIGSFLFRRKAGATGRLPRKIRTSSIDGGSSEVVHLSLSFSLALGDVMYLLNLMEVVFL